MDELILGYKLIEQGYERMTDAAVKLDKANLTDEGLQLAFTLMQFRKEMMLLIRRYGIEIDGDIEDDALEKMDAIIADINRSTEKIKQLGD